MTTGEVVQRPERGDASVDAHGTDDYLARIGAPSGAAPDAAFLAELQERHQRTVPFENIDFHLGVPVRLGEPTWDKVVRRRRGGTCRELNASAFPTLLRALGYPVTLLGSRLFLDGRLSFAMAHTVIRVDCPEPWLVDVGFGKDGARRPLRIDTREPQPDPAGTSVFADAPDGDLDLIQDGKPVLRIETRPRTVDDFAPALWWFESSPDSPFRRNLFCTRATDSGRVTLRGDVLTVTEDTDRTRVTLDDAGIERAYREHFGIVLDRLPPVPRPG